MNRFLASLLIAVFCTGTLPSFGVEPTKHKRSRRPQRAQFELIEKEYNGKVFRVLNAQTDFTGEPLMRLTREVRYITLLPVEVLQGEIKTGRCPFEAADELVASKDVGAGAIIVKDEKLPIFTLAPDRRWGILNIAKLVSDNPDQEKLKSRFTKAYWGIVARTLGAGNSTSLGCVLQPFANVNELDAIRALRPCPEPFNAMVNTAACNGIGTISVASYQAACEQGWAPAPTNDVQKAIWEKVHSIPDKPLKIKFDPASQKGKVTK